MQNTCANQIRKIKCVKEAKIVIGTYDAFAKIERESIEEIEKIYINAIDEIDGILDFRLNIVACHRTGMKLDFYLFLFIFWVNKYSISIHCVHKLCESPE